MKRTILFTTALAAAVGLFALGAAQASGKSGKGEVRSEYQIRNLYLSDDGSAYRERNAYTERNEHHERDDNHEHDDDRRGDDLDGDRSDD